MADLQVTNPSDERLAVTDITGHYMNGGVPVAEASLTCMHTYNNQCLVLFIVGTGTWYELPLFMCSYCWACLRV